jgi:hypothetical protein
MPGEPKVDKKENHEIDGFHKIPSLIFANYH